ncbi:hypothetical protein NE237_024796 [Protea cynaroides]|uniref:Uncharacterized protein n=1 Tax=Protea cynaroides TaxID=273540 RepID=A0A9Q0H411_9MAGN|nr:hypothetical protein NE237_024796 [Protea cynaroides]
MPKNGHKNKDIREQKKKWGRGKWKEHVNPMSLENYVDFHILSLPLLRLLASNCTLNTHTHSYGYDTNNTTVVAVFVSCPCLRKLTFLPSSLYPFKFSITLLCSTGTSSHSNVGKENVVAMATKRNQSLDRLRRDKGARTLLL